LERELEQSDPDTKRVLVAKKSEVIIGIGRVERTSDDPGAWMVFGLAVHPDYRRQGIGRALVHASVGFARSRGARTVRSETHADNRASIAFHESVGFAHGRCFTAPDGDEILAFSMVLAD